MSVIGVDVGGSGCKACVVRGDGSVAGYAYREYSTSSPGPGMEEIDPELVWASVKEVVARAAAESPGARDGYDRVRALSVASFGESVVPLDARGRPLRASLMYSDCRGSEEAAELEDRIGGDRAYALAGAAIHPMYSVCKIMWLRRHEPEVFGRAWKFLLFADYVLFRMGAEPATDYSLAARTLALDVAQLTWSAEILGAAGLDESSMGEAVQAGSVVGEIGAGLADELGLPRGVVLAAGGHDQACVALGTGAVAGRIAADGLGTTECVTPVLERPTISEAMRRSGFACVPHVVPGRYVTYAFTFSCGSALRWYRDVIGAPEREEARARGIDPYELIISRIPAGPTRLLALPHFAGAATPHMDPGSRAAIVGLDLATGGPDIAKAILEGLTFESLVNVEALAAAGIEVDELRVVGGLAKSPAYLQLKADIMGRRLVALQSSEAGALGAAILAGLASGEFRDLAEAISRVARTGRSYEPDSELHGAYRERFEAYRRLYGALRPLAGARS